MISDHISDQMPPKMKILNMVISILISNALLQFPLRLERCKLHEAAGHPLFYIIQSDAALQNQVH